MPFNKILAEIIKSVAWIREQTLAVHLLTTLFVRQKWSIVWWKIAILCDRNALGVIGMTKGRNKVFYNTRVLRVSLIALCKFNKKVNVPVQININYSIKRVLITTCTLLWRKENKL